ncbi:10025_t:CDS:1, partial [Gigaspora margarita]
VSVQEVLFDMDWKSTNNSNLHKIYIKLDDLISQTEILLVEGNNIVTKSWWLQPLETPTKEYYQEFNNFMDTYLYNSVW